MRPFQFGGSPPPDPAPAACHGAATRTEPAPAAPRRAGRKETRTRMLEVLIALMPALLLSGCFLFGPRAFWLTAVSAAGCAGMEALYRRVTGQTPAWDDLSAVVTGVLLAFCLPVTTPYWAVLVGDFFAIVVVKQLFGGLGKNFLNPALAARMFLFSFPELMSRFTEVRVWTDAQSAATPMAALQGGVLPAFTLQEMFAGVRGGCMGEVSAALLLFGGAYLVLRRVIRLRIPLCYLGTAAVLSYGFSPPGIDPVQWMLYGLMGGGLLLGAIFMATDPATAPVTGRGQVLYGVGCGVLTVVLRRYGGYPEGVAVAILTMNLASRGLGWLVQTCGRRGEAAA
ncbi:MAG: RnfABCDGE type electron transport complex subunit D [Pseudoflavonifractor sp.]